MFNPNDPGVISFNDALTNAIRAARPPAAIAQRIAAGGYTPTPVNQYAGALLAHLGANGYLNRMENARLHPSIASAILLRHLLG